MDSLTDLIPAGAIAAGVSAADWPAAIRAAGALLEDAECITAAYTNACIDVVDIHGPYIVIAPGFALAHAQAPDQVQRTALSWINLTTPVEFNHRHDPVDIVAMLAAADSHSHRKALAQMASLLQDSERMRRIRSASDAESLRAELTTGEPSRSGAAVTPREASTSRSTMPRPSHLVPSCGHILTVCGNGLGTSLFLKNTVEQVLTAWGWSNYLTVEATDTISARGKAKDADCVLTSAEIAKTLGNLDVPSRVIQNFTSESEIDSALRSVYWTKG